MYIGYEEKKVINPPQIPDVWLYHRLYGIEITNVYREHIQWVGVDPAVLPML